MGSWLPGFYYSHTVSLWWLRQPQGTWQPLLDGGERDGEGGGEGNGEEEEEVGEVDVLRHCQPSVCPCLKR